MTWFRTSLGRALLGLLALLSVTAAHAGSCSGTACVVAGPRLASVDSSRSVILNALLEGLLGGGNVSAAVIDWNAVAQTDVRLDTFLNLLRANVGAGSVQDALNTQISVATLITTAAQAAQADGATAAASALNALAAQVGGLSGTLRLGDLLQLSFPAGAFADARLNLLNLVLGGAQLFNSSNAVTTGSTPVTLAPVSVNLSALGLGASTVTPTVQAFVQVIEPPVYTCGPQGTTFHTAGVRVKLNVDLGGLNLNVLNGVGLDTGTDLTLSQLTLYLEVARASGTIGLVNAVADAVTLTVQPGVAQLALGTLNDAAFFNRTNPTPFSGLTAAKIGTAQLTVLGVGAVNLDVTAVGQATSTSGSASLTFTGPYPQTQTVSAGAAGVTDLVTSLVNSLTVGVTLSAGQSIPPLLAGTVNAAVTNALAPVTNTVKLVLRPVLISTVTALIDQVLTLLGVRIGEAVLTVAGVSTVCTVTGRVYSDAQPDGTRDPAETWTGPAVNVNALRGGQVVTTAAVPTGSGTFSLAVPENTDTLLVSTSPTATAPAAPTGFVFVNPVGGQVSLSVSAGSLSVPDQDFGLFAGDRLNVLVFRDNGPSGGVPHDVIRQASEQPVSGLTLTAAGSGGTRAATTDASGAALLYLPLGWTGVTLDASVTPARDALTGLSVDGSVTFATDATGTGLRPAPLPAPAGAVRTVQLGLTGRPALTPDRAGRAEAPATLVYAHTLAPGTPGTLTVTTGGPFPASVAIDRDCDGTISNSERAAQGSALTVDASWPRDASGALSACAAEVTVQVPAGTAPGTVGATPGTLTLTWSARPVTDAAQVTDTTTVISGASVVKSVQNVTTGDPAGTAIQARPGDRLRYCLNVTNTTPDPITGATLSDTLIGAATYLPGTLTLDGAALTDATDADAAEFTSGTVTYRLGTLTPAAMSRACFDVQVP